MRRLDRSRSGFVAKSEVGATWLFTIGVELGDDLLLVVGQRLRQRREMRGQRW
jgi:hypothetical protein